MNDVENVSYIRYATENPLYKRIDELNRQFTGGKKYHIYSIKQI